MSNKKQRGSNFSELEINFLIESVKSQKHIIEDKKTDSSANKSKKAAWIKIEKDFRENPECEERKVEQLMTKWKDLKKNAKDAISAYLKYQSGTGGGPAPSELKETFKTIWDMLPGQFERIPNEYDDDASLMSGQMKRTDNANVLSDLSQDFEIESQTIESNDQAGDQSIDAEPKSKLRKLNHIPKVIPTKPMQCANSDTKQEILELTKKNMMEEHQLRIKFMHEEHELKMMAIRQEIIASQNKSNYFIQKTMAEKKQTLCSSVAGHVFLLIHSFDFQIPNEFQSGRQVGDDTPNISLAYL